MKPLSSRLRWVHWSVTWNFGVISRGTWPALNLAVYVILWSLGAKLLAATTAPRRVESPSGASLSSALEIRTEPG